MNRAAFLTEIKRTGSHATVLQFADWLEERGEYHAASMLRAIDCDSGQIPQQVNAVLAAHALAARVRKAAFTVMDVANGFSAFGRALRRARNAITTFGAATTDLLDDPETEVYQRHRRRMLLATGKERNMRLRTPRRIGR